MKTYIAVAAAAIAALISFEGYAQRTPDGWKQKMEQGRLSYVISELKLDEKEEREFRKVDAKVSETKDKAFDATGEAFRNLDLAIKEGKSEKQIKKCLEAYIDAKEKCNEIEKDAFEAYGKVLSDEKLARLIVAEEKFRRNMFRQMHSGNRDGRGKSGEQGRPDGQGRSDGQGRPGQGRPDGR